MTTNLEPTGFDWNTEQMQESKPPLADWSRKRKILTAAVSALLGAGLVAGSLAVTHRNTDAPTVGHDVTHVQTTQKPAPASPGAVPTSVAGPGGAAVLPDGFSKAETDAFGEQALGQIGPEMQGQAAGFLANSAIADGEQTPAQMVSGAPLIADALVAATKNPTDLYMDTIRDAKQGVLFAAPYAHLTGIWHTNPAGAKISGFGTSLGTAKALGLTIGDQPVEVVSWTADATWYYTQKGKTGVQAISLERDYQVFLVPNPDPANGESWMITGYKTSAIRSHLG